MQPCTSSSSCLLLHRKYEMLSSSSIIAGGGKRRGQNISVGFLLACSTDVRLVGVHQEAVRDYTGPAPLIRYPTDEQAKTCIQYWLCVNYIISLVRPRTADLETKYWPGPFLMVAYSQVWKFKLEDSVVLDSIK